MSRLAQPIDERFWPKVDKESDGDCWNWTAAVCPAGYGVFHRSGVGASTRASAHRVAYELLVGPIPEGLELDHLCRNRRCVNPAHLEPVTHRENTLRSEFVNWGGVLSSTKTHCPKGHPYSGDNLYINPRGDRECRQCRRQASLRRAQRRDA